MAVKFKSEDQALYIKDVTFYWASVHSPKPKFDPSDGNEYVADIIVSASDAKALKKIKLNKGIKEIGVDVDEERFPGHEGDFVFKGKAPEFTAKGKKLQIKVVGPDGKPITENIGNESKGNVKFFVWEGDKGISKGKLNSRINVVHVTDLVPYNDVSGGYDEELGIDLSEPDDTDIGSEFDDDDIPFDQ